jgi:hypothetical protein
MKTLLLTLLTTLPLLTFAQNKKIVYEDVVEAKGISKNELMKKAKYWFLSTYPESVLHLDTTDNKLIGVGVLCLRGLFTTGDTVKFTAIIDFKNERYRYVLTDFKCIYINAATPPRRITTPLEEFGRSAREEVNDEIKNKISSLHEYLISPETDW